MAFPSPVVGGLINIPGLVIATCEERGISVIAYS